MNLIEQIPMPPISAQSIELTAMIFLKKYFSNHFEQSGTLSFREMIHAVWVTYEYRIELVDSYGDNVTESRVNFFTKKIEMTEEFMFKLENGDGRCLFTLAHEISHIILHSEYIELCSKRAARVLKFLPQQKIKTYESSEWQAEHCAGALLMPIRTVYPFYLKNKIQGYSDSTLFEIIADKFGVTASAAKSRIKAILKPNLETLTSKIKIPNLY